MKRMKTGAMTILVTHWLDNQREKRKKHSWDSDFSLIRDRSDEKQQL